MHVGKFLHELLNNTIHKSRIKSITPVIEAVITSKTLQLTQLGRSLNTPGKERAGIRRIDRLLANPFYQNKSMHIYKAISTLIVRNQDRPHIIIDWSGLPNSRRVTKQGEHMVLRAALVAQGRAITLYDEVHSRKKDGCPKTHEAFLKNLQLVLPKGCRPIIITDAGFKVPWFRSVLKMGWDYIGRVRGKLHYDAGQGYQPISTLYPSAKYTPQAKGVINLTKANDFKTNLYIYKHKLKGRKKLTRTGVSEKTIDAIQRSRGYREPWVIVSSLEKKDISAKCIINIYKSRMTIEENFRDVKSNVTGLSMNDNITILAERFIVWLILSALASLIAWIVGYSAEKKGLHYDFQVNTYSSRRVLSFFYLGCQIIKKKIKVPVSINNFQIHIWSATP